MFISFQVRRLERSMHGLRQWMLVDNLDPAHLPNIHHTPEKRTPFYEADAGHLNKLSGDNCNDKKLKLGM